MSARADRIRERRASTRGVQTNWAVVGLSGHNTVLLDVGGDVHDSGERPSEWIGLEYLTAAERAVLRRGLTPGGKDRPKPVEEGSK